MHFFHFGTICPLFTYFESVADNVSLCFDGDINYVVIDGTSANGTAYKNEPAVLA